MDDLTSNKSSEITLPTEEESKIKLLFLNHITSNPKLIFSEP